MSELYSELRVGSWARAGKRVGKRVRFYEKLRT